MNIVTRGRWNELLWLRLNAPTNSEGGNHGGARCHIKIIYILVIDTGDALHNVIATRLHEYTLLISRLVWAK